jgi:hypothetical protein
MRCECEFIKATDASALAGLSGKTLSHAQTSIRALWRLQSAGPSRCIGSCMYPYLYLDAHASRSQRVMVEATLGQARLQWGLTHNSKALNV